jgi:hypothetical protein
MKNLGAVNMPEWKMNKQVAESVNVQFFAQQFSPLRAYTL